MTSAEAQIRVQSELHVGENLVWSGVPDARRAAVAAIPKTLLPGILFGGAGLLVMIYEYGAGSAMPKTSSHPISPILAALVMGLPFVIAGLINLLRPLWIYGRRLKRSYGVTNQPVMIISGGSVRSIKRGDIFDVKYRERRNGSGEVMIRTNFSVHSKNRLARKQGWLYSVPNAKEVAGQVYALTGRQTLEPGGFLGPVSLGRQWRSFEKKWLASRRFGIPEVAQADTHKPIALVWREIHSCSQL